MPVSSFRDFARQLAIWNAKFSGETPLYDADGRTLEAARLAPEERIAAILRWSALPGRAVTTGERISISSIGTQWLRGIGCS